MAASSLRRGGWLPNQHGAWAMLLSPLVAGIVIAGPHWLHVPLALAWFLGYFAFFAGSQWLKSRRSARFVPALRTYAAAAAALAAACVAARPGLLAWGAAFAPLLGIAAYESWRRRDRSLLAGFSETAAAALMTCVVVQAAGHPVDGRTWVLVLVQLGYLFGTVLYVKSMIRKRGDRGFVALSAGYHAVLAAAAWWVGSPWLAVVLLVLTARAALLPLRRMTPKQVGLLEIPCHIAVLTVALLTTS